MSATVGEVLTTLQEMGFSKERAEKALTKTGWKGVEPAMEWLLAHPEGQDDDEDDDDLQAAAAQEEEQKPKKELTEEEKAEQLKRLEELRVKKRAEREEREAKEALDKEKRMRQEGKALSGLKRDLEDQEIKRMAEQRRREKEETKAAKEKVKAQIEADRQARREREAERRGETVQAPVAAQSPPKPEEEGGEAKTYTEARLQIRLPSGAPIVQTFKAKETLSAVRLYVELNGGGSGVKLMTSFPRRVFGEEDYEKPLEALGLVPSAVLMVQK